MRSCILGPIAIDAWLREFESSEKTLRSYTREIERFYLWLAALQRKGLASSRQEDLKAYTAFMEAPPADWCGDRYNRRGTSAWRPFEGPLAVRSCAYARTVISSRSVVHAVEQHADAFSPTDLRQKAAAERLLFVLRFLANTGLRRDEFATARMSDIVSHEDVLTGAPYWTMEVRGKGGKLRTIAVNEGALGALRRYRQALGTSVNFIGNESPVPLPVWGERGRHHRFLNAHVVYEDVQAAIWIAQEAIAPEDPSLAESIGNVTPHWLRHTGAMILDQLGVKPELIQMQLRHASLDTTVNIYTASEDRELVAALTTLQIQE